jgi:hypothetical protein
MRRFWWKQRLSDAALETGVTDTGQRSEGGHYGVSFSTGHQQVE